jgi:hypothetical protein
MEQLVLIGTVCAALTAAIDAVRHLASLAP